MNGLFRINSAPADKIMSPQSPMDSSLRELQNLSQKDSIAVSRMLESGEEQRHLGLDSDEDEQLYASFARFEEDLKNLIQRVESRKAGYSTFMQAKKQVSAVKNSFLHGLTEIKSLIMEGKHAPQRSKLEQLTEICEELSSRHKNLQSLFSKRTEISLDLQMGLMEQADSYVSRMVSCLAHNRKRTAEIKEETSKIFAFLAQIDSTIKILKQMKHYLVSVGKLQLIDASKSRRKVGSVYVPYAQRDDKTDADKESLLKIESDLTAAKIAKRVEDMRQDKADLAECKKRIYTLTKSRNASEQFLNKLMKDRENIENVLGTISTALRSLRQAKEKLHVHQADVDCSLYDHSQCQDCTMIPDIARQAQVQLIAASITATRMTEQLNKILVNGEELKNVKVDVASFGASEAPISSP